MTYRLRAALLPVAASAVVLAIGGIALAGCLRVAMADFRAGEPPATPSAAAPEGAMLAALVMPAAAAPDPAMATARAELIELAQREPMAVARKGRQRLETEVRDFACLFVKQEFVKGALKDVEEIEVRYRVAPHSVYMFWKKNADRVKRALYVDSPKFVDSGGQKIAKIEPAGSLIRLIVSEVEMPIHGQDAREASRRTIDEFGFPSTFNILEKYNEIGEKNGVLDYRYDGEGQIDGRPTLRFVRYLPYTGPDGQYPDAKMILHVDQEWLLPTAVYSYADRDGRQLLGSYVYTQVRLNPGFKENDFEF